MDSSDILLLFEDQTSNNVYLPSLSIPRAMFAFQPMCGKFAAIGGTSDGTDIISSSESLEWLSSEPMIVDQWRLKEPLFRMGSVAVKDIACWH